MTELFTTDQSILGVVLAGGKSSRMMRDKAMLLHPNGNTYLEFAVQRLGQIVTNVAVSGRSEGTAGIINIPDRSPNLGPAMAVGSAVQFAKLNGFTAILVTPVDMPDISSEDLKQLIDAASLDQPTCATFDLKTPHPLVAIYPTALEQELADVANSDRRSLLAWLEKRPTKLIGFPLPASRDVNTPVDYSAIPP